MRNYMVLLGSTVAAVLLACGVAWADVLTVRNVGDSGPGSLRAAITKANVDPGRDVVIFAPEARGTIALRSALPHLAGQLEIRGPGASRLTVRRAVTDGFRVFNVAGGANVSIANLTISDGSSNAGGGISNAGTVVLKGLTVSDNSTSWCGGGMHNEGEARVEDSTFTGNFADSCGGGIVNFKRLAVVSTTFSNNTAAGGGANGGGGGIHNDRILFIENSTFVGNMAGDETTPTGLGGGIQNHKSTSTIVGSTFFDNSATQAGGGIRNGAGLSPKVYLRTSIVAGNSAGREGPDLGGGSFVSRGYNLVGDPDGRTDLEPTDIISAAPRFDPRGLQSYGGPTETLALTRYSPAVDAVARDACTLSRDQRGAARPQDGDGDGVARCDIGAYERPAPTSP